MTQLVLASASPARLGQLRAAGIDPEVVPSHVDETIALQDIASAVVALAERKALAVAATLPGRDAVVVGCDSMFDFDGEAFGKPEDPPAAIERWHRMRGRSGVIHTGHCLIDLGRGDSVTAVASATVHFGEPSDAEIEAYVATGEPLGVAGGCTLDGLSAPFIEGIEGDHGAVIGISLATLRRLLAELGIEITSLWRP